MIRQEVQPSNCEKPDSCQRSLVALFRSLVATSTFAFLAGTFGLWVHGDGVSPETSDLLRHDGSMAILPLPTFVVGLLVLLWVAAAIGLWQFNRHARLGFLLLTVTSVALTALGGVAVQLPFEEVLEYAVALMDGAILAMAYFSPLKGKFAVKENVKGSPIRGSGQDPTIPPDKGVSPAD